MGKPTQTQPDDVDGRALIVAAKRVVIKVGTNVVMRPDGGIALGRLYGLIESIVELRRQGREVLLVSSGAVGLGARRLGIAGQPKQLDLKQACAAIGQSRLMSIYESGFEKLDLVAAQVLLTEDDFNTRKRYLNLRATLGRLLELGTIPVINENDTISTVELETPVQGTTRAFGDNDKLSALLMSKIDADLLVLLSDVDGLYTANPKKGEGEPIPIVREITPEIMRAAGSSSFGGRGGMVTKLEAARIATSCGGIAVVANGMTPGVLDRLFAGEPAGTIFLPRVWLPIRKRWIAFGSASHGIIVVNEGARRALIDNKASLLPAGVVRIDGTFEKGSVVTISSTEGNEIARGIVNFSSNEMRVLIQRAPDEMRGAAGRKGLITRDNIVLIS